MKCPECNSEINDDIKFCEYCGYKLPEKEILPAMREAPIPEPKPNYFPRLEVVQDKHQRIRELEKKVGNKK